LCENLRSRVEAELRSEGEPITVSIGAAELLGHEDAASWLARADLALYRAKRAGRNRVEVDDGRTPPPAVLQEPDQAQ
jgi:diguanylate cyclase